MQLTEQLEEMKKKLQLLALKYNKEHKEAENVQSNQQKEISRYANPILDLLSFNILL